MRKYTTWLKTAAIFQLITAIIHAISLFQDPPPNNDVERQMFDLIQTYKFDFGGGFHRTMNDLTIALSSCFSLVCLLGGLITYYLVIKKTHPDVMRGIIWINLVIFGICFVIMATFTFLPPIVLTGLIFIFLILAACTLTKKQ